MPALKDRFAATALGMVMFVPAIAFSPLSSERFREPKLLFGEILAGIAALGLAAVSGKELFNAGWRSLAWFLTVAAAAVSLVNTAFVPAGLEELSRIFTLALFYFLVVRAGAAVRLLGFVMLAGALNSLLALAQWQGLGFPSWVPFSGRLGVYGTFGNPNFLAEYLAPVFLLSAAATFWSRSAVRSSVSGAAAVLAFSALLLTVSRAAWLGLAAGAAVFLILARREMFSSAARARGFLLLAALASVAALSWRPLWIRAASSFTLSEPGISTRFFMWQAAARIAAEHPVLGAGPGGYSLGYLDAAARIQEEGESRPSYSGITRDAHNDFLQLVADRGILGAAAWAFVFGFVLSRALPRLASATGAEKIMLSSVLGGVAAVSVAACFGFPMRIFPTAALFVWMLAVAAGPDSRGAGVPAKAAAAAVLLAALVLTALAARSFTADAYMGAAGGEAGMEERIGKGLKLVPRHGKLHFRLGILLFNSGKMEEAAEEFQSALAGFKDPDVRFNLGLIALRTGDYEGAVAHFKEGIKAYPYYRPNAYTDLAEALLKLGRLEEARSAALKAMSVEPGYPRAAALLEKINR